MTRLPTDAFRPARRRLIFVVEVALCVAVLLASVGASAASDETPSDPAQTSGEKTSQSDERSTHYYLGFFTAGSWVDATPSETSVPPGGGTDSSFFWGANLGVERPIASWLDLRLELEGTNERKFSFATPGGDPGDRSDIEAWTFQGNFWFVVPLRKWLPDTPVLNRISPFGGGGVGLSRNTFDAVSGNADGTDTSVTFAWQGGVGLTFDVTRWLVLDVRYQYIDLGKPSVSLSDSGTPAGSLEFDLGGNEIVGGLRFVY